MKGLPIGLLTTAPRYPKHGAGRWQGLVDPSLFKGNAHRIAVTFRKGQLAYTLEIIGEGYFKACKKGSSGFSVGNPCQELAG